MKKTVLALITLIIIGMVIPAVSASGDQTEIYDTRYEFKKIELALTDDGGKSASPMMIYVGNSATIDSLQSIFYRPSANAPNFLLYDNNIKTQTKPVYFRAGSSGSGAIVGTGTFTYFKGATTAQSHIRIDFNTYDKSLGATTNLLYIDFLGDTCNLRTLYATSQQAGANFYLRGDSSNNKRAGSYQIEYYSNFLNTFTLTDYNATCYKLAYSRGGNNLYDSQIIISDKNGNTLLTNSGVSSSYIYVNKDAEPYTIQVYATNYRKDYVTSIGDGEPWIPPDEEEPTVVQPVMRTGSVTMTDNNGTTITGFDVRAVNAYTGRSYTVVTQTDVAVMTLPMERTISLRNPQTGEYEEVPIGYYRFYGQSPGYKMLYEDGIQVSVVPEEYSSYELCDIRVTSESGYLTGTHQFQIRSRADNSVLQTGTISAQSATTGNWFNTTVSDGLATLILPYDTSNSISQYAGNYAVYATSPGYQDSDYGTQITVMPHTVSEIRDILLTPIGGVPTPGNVTLRIQAFSETGPGVVNAKIFIAGVLGAGSDVWDTYTASSTGYLAVSVPGNSTYDIVASGAGFYDSARRVTVFDDDPPLIEIKLYYLSGAPTVEPTTQPTGWPTEPPTTQPTGEPTNNWLEWFAAHFGMILGGGVEIGKIFMWLCFAVPVGVYVGKEAKAGAAGFMAGAGIVTLFFVLIGWVPIWLLVLLALIIGLLYAKVFNNSDTGGGR